MAEKDEFLKALADAVNQINRARDQAKPPDLFAVLKNLQRPRQPFPPCADVLLSLVPNRPAPPSKDLIVEDFDDYFAFEAPAPIQLPGDLAGINGDLAKLVKAAWPPSCCVCPPVVKLKGVRNAPPREFHQRVYAGDIIWLFYYERMGIFKILGALLDDYATRGRFPISSGGLDAGAADDNIAIVLEVMVSAMKTGVASSVRDRDSSYRRVLGWTSDVGRQTGSQAQANSGFNTLLHQFLNQALVFYRDRRLAQAIQGTLNSTTPPTTATLTAIADTLRVLRQHLEPFDYGRNYYNVLNGIVWTVAGISVVSALRNSLGIPSAFNSPHEFIPAAYELLVSGRGVSQADPNRYTVHRTCARTGRDLLLDIEGLPEAAIENAVEGQALDGWLRLVETKVESYRTAYQTLTGLDLAQKITPEQAV